MIRPLGLQDLAHLNRTRNRGIFLDSAPTLLWGRAVVPLGALLSSFSAVTGVFTSIANAGEDALIGQIAHTHGSSFAHFTFLAPESAAGGGRFPELVEHLIQRAGARGAQSLIAELDEQSAMLGVLRAAGFSIYARQRIWRLGHKLDGARDGWRRAEFRDGLAANLLCSGLVPGLVQQVEPTPWDGLSGYVNYQRGELAAYVDLRRGPRGQWLQPFVALDAPEAGALLAGLFARLRPRRGRPLYICVRSYQSWLEPHLRALGAQPSPRQAVVVKRTARPVKAAEGRRLPVAEGRRAEPTTPIQMPTPFVRRELELMSYDQTTNYR